jgi:hypothetical protein
MRVGIAAFFIVASVNLFATEQSQQVDGNVHCIDRFRVPAYPGIAVSARLYGDVDATVQLGPGGVVRDLAVAGKPHPLLANAVFDAIRASTFRRTCIDRSVSLSFHFRIEGKGTDYPTSPVVSFGFPNTFWIVSAPRNVQP